MACICFWRTLYHVGRAVGGYKANAKLGRKPLKANKPDESCSQETHKLTFGTNGGDTIVLQWETVDGSLGVRSETSCLLGVSTTVLVCETCFQAFWVCASPIRTFFLKRRDQSRLLADDGVATAVHSASNAVFNREGAERGKATYCPGVELKRMPWRTSRLLGYTL